MSTVKPVYYTQQKLTNATGYPSNIETGKPSPFPTPSPYKQSPLSFRNDTVKRKESTASLPPSKRTRFNEDDPSDETGSKDTRTRIQRFRNEYSNIVPTYAQIMEGKDLRYLRYATKVHNEFITTISKTWQQDPEAIQHIPSLLGTYVFPTIRRTAFLRKGILLTGKFEYFTRIELEEFIKAHGGTVFLNVMNACDLVVCGKDPNKTKLERADSLCIRIVEELDWLNDITVNHQATITSIHWNPYRPSGSVLCNARKLETLDSFIDNYSAIQSLKKMLKTWSTRPDDSKRVIWLHGPSGSGKSKSVSLCAEGAELKTVVVFDALSLTDPRRLEYFKSLVMLRKCLCPPSTTRRTQMMSTPVKTGLCVVIDEMDCINFECNRSTLRTLGDIVKRSEIPIVCISNVKYSPLFSPLTVQAEYVQYYNPRAEKVGKSLIPFCDYYGMEMYEKTLAKIHDLAGLDMRSTLNHIQWLSYSKTPVIAEEDNTSIVGRWYTDWPDHRYRSPFQIMEILTNSRTCPTTLSEIRNLYTREQRNEISEFIWGNYNDLTDDMDIAASISESISYGDTMIESILPVYQWETHSIILPASLVRATRENAPVFTPPVTGLYVKKANQLQFVLDKVWTRMTVPKSRPPVRAVRRPSKLGQIRKEEGEERGSKEYINYWIDDPAVASILKTITPTINTRVRYRYTDETAMVISLVSNVYAWSTTSRYAGLLNEHQYLMDTLQFGSEIAYTLAYYGNNTNVPTTSENTEFLDTLRQRELTHAINVDRMRSNHGNEVKFIPISYDTTWMSRKRPMEYSENRSKRLCIESTSTEFVPGVCNVLSECTSPGEEMEEEYSTLKHIVHLELPKALSVEIDRDILTFGSHSRTPPELYDYMFPESISKFFWVVNDAGDGNCGIYALLHSISYINLIENDSYPSYNRDSMREFICEGYKILYENRDEFLIRICRTYYNIPPPDEFKEKYNVDGEYISGNFWTVAAIVLKRPIYLVDCFGTTRVYQHRYPFSEHRTLNDGFTHPICIAWASTTYNHFVSLIPKTRTIDVRSHLADYTGSDWELCTMFSDYNLNSLPKDVIELE